MEFDAKARRRLTALIRKEFIQIIYDPSTILISLFLPLLLLFLYGSGVSLDLDHLRVGLVMQDTAPDAQSFAKSMTDSRFLDVNIGHQVKPMTERIMESKIRGFVVLPSYFTEDRFREDVAAPIQVIADGSEPNTATFVRNYMTQTYSNWLKQESISSGLTGLPFITISPRFWFNEELDSRNFLLPGSLAIIMTLIGTLLTALVIAREWERGTMEALMSTPVTIIEIIIGKIVPYFVLGQISMMLCTLGAIFIYNVPFRGSYPALFLVTSCFLVTCLSLGLLISTATKNQFAASQAAIFSAFLPAYMLSVFIFEISSMPIWIQYITYLIPARYFVSCLLTLFLVGDVWSLIIANLIPMLAFGILLIYINSRMLVKRIE